METGGRIITELTQPEFWFFSHAPKPTTEAIFRRAVGKLNPDTAPAMTDTELIPSESLEFRLTDGNVLLTTESSHLSDAAVESLITGLDEILSNEFRNTYYYSRFGSLSLLLHFATVGDRYRSLIGSDRSDPFFDVLTPPKSSESLSVEATQRRPIEDCMDYYTFVSAEDIPALITSTKSAMVKKWADSGFEAKNRDCDCCQVSSGRLLPLLPSLGGNSYALCKDCVMEFYDSLYPDSIPVAQLHDPSSLHTGTGESVAFTESGAAGTD